ncbi:hypothetical protein QBC39DRAFT_372206 [Podospora conica]|nr:hypothetical protein QBC39DRAFT_372206 [Schizothecium conicum]
MPRQDLEYPNESFSTVNRYSTRAQYALKTIHEIVNTCPILHVSFNTPDSPFPATLPMIGQMGSFDSPSADVGDVQDLYLHGYVSSRIINLSRAASDGKGLPMTIAASHVDGIVLALTPNSHSLNYRSALLFGHALPVADTAEKLYAMQLITDGLVPSRWAHTRVPPNAAEMQSTAVLRVRVATGSAKIRTGEPHDERGDLADAALRARVWTGVVPVWQTLGEPVPGSYNELDVPAYLEDHRRERNEEAQKGAVAAAREET